ncbi:MAG: glycosyltransferase family 2 protein, partial [Planctomycetota bacterium]
LREAVESVVRQEYRPLEIIVGDDSPTPAAENVVAAALESSGIAVRYRSHTPSLGQSGNVNDLFARARGEYLVLLHDDDFLLPGAVSALVAPTIEDAGVRLVFGMQRLVRNDGVDLGDQAADGLNRNYHRTREAAGVQPSTLAAGLRKQIPNNGYLVASDAARQTGYRSRELVGDVCDTDFGIRLGKLLGRDSCCLIAHDTVAMRLSDRSITSRGIVATSAFFDFVEGLDVPPEDEPAKAACLRSFARAAVRENATEGNHRRALEILGSYPQRRLSRALQLVDAPWLISPATMHAVRGGLRRLKSRRAA